MKFSFKKMLLSALLLGSVGSTTLTVDASKLEEEIIYPTYLIEEGNDGSLDDKVSPELEPFIHIGETLVHMNIQRLSPSATLRSINSTNRASLSAGSVGYYTNIKTPHKIGVGFLNFDNALISIGEVSNPGNSSGTIKLKNRPLFENKYHLYIRNTGSTTITNKTASIIG